MIESLVNSRLHEYEEAVYSAAKPPPKLTVSQWADEYRYLSKEVCAEPGRWKTSRAPYQREIMDAFNDPTVEEIAVQSSCQVGKSEIVNNVIGYFIHWDPAPLLMVQPTFKLAEDYSKERIATMIRDTAVLKEIIENSPKTGYKSNTILNKSYPGGHLSIAGANAPGNLCSRPKRIVLLDEVDRMPETSEGDSVLLAFQRTKNFWNRKKAQFSTPIYAGKSKIDIAYQGSDQRKYNVPCPHCGLQQVFMFSRLRWKKGPGGADKPETTQYLCAGCKKLINHSHLTWMLRHGKWVAEKPFNGIAGFWVNELYSPWSSWAEMVGEYLKARNNQSKLQVWTNTSDGKTFKIKGDAPDWKRLYERRELYKIEEIQPGGVILVGGVDVQKDRIEMEVVSYGRGLESWSINYIILQGDIAKPEVWRKLAVEIERRYKFVGNDRLLPIRMVAIDSSAYSQTVYAFVRKYPGNRVIAVKGSDSLMVPIDIPKKVDVYVSGKRKSRGLKLWTVGSSELKKELYGFLRLDKPGPGIPEPGYCHYPEYSQEYFKQLTAEQLVKKINSRGYVQFSWEKQYTRNEALDCRNYARAASSLIGIDRWTNKDWDFYQQKALSDIVHRGGVDFVLDKSPEMSDNKQLTGVAGIATKTIVPVSAGKKIKIQRKKRISSFWG